MVEINTPIPIPIPIPNPIYSNTRTNLNEQSRMDYRIRISSESTLCELNKETNNKLTNATGEK